MSHERIVPAIGEQKAQLEVECATMLGSQSFPPEVLERFLDNMFCLMGSDNGETTPDLKDNGVLVYLRKEEGTSRIFISPKEWKTTGKPYMIEMIWVHKFGGEGGGAVSRTFVNRILQGDLSGQQYSFASYLNGETTIFQREGKHHNFALVTAEEANNLAGKIFSAWQKSQGEIIIA